MSILITQGIKVSLALMRLARTAPGLHAEPRSRTDVFFGANETDTWHRNRRDETIGLIDSNERRT